MNVPTLYVTAPLERMPPPTKPTPVVNVSDNTSELDAPALRKASSMVSWPEAVIMSGSAVTASMSLPPRSCAANTSPATDA